MKNLFSLLCLIGFSTSFLISSAQIASNNSDAIPTDYLERNAIYDYSERQLNNTDSIPDFLSKRDPLMISGTIYQSDGKTPAKDVILYITQPDENGKYDLAYKDEKRYIKHRGWIKTDADGRYTFYTFVPGNYTPNKELKHIHPRIKEPGKAEYDLNAFLFDNDPFLSAHCRKRLDKKGIDNILKLEKKENLWVANKDIILESETSQLK